jgi:hypothetical protein
MLNSFATHLRHNVVGYLALFLAMTMGTAYASEHLIGTDDIEDDAVTTPKIANQAVTNQKIAGQTIQANRIANEAITNQKIAFQAVQTGRFANGAVTTAKLANGAVASEKLANGAVTTEKLANLVRRAGPVVNVPPGEVRAATAFCEPGEKLISGGPFWTTTPTGDMPSLDSWSIVSQDDPNVFGWRARSFNGTDEEKSLRVFLLCF